MADYVAHQIPSCRPPPPLNRISSQEFVGMPSPSSVGFLVQAPTGGATRLRQRKPSFSRLRHGTSLTLSHLLGFLGADLFDILNATAEQCERSRLSFVRLEAAGESHRLCAGVAFSNATHARSACRRSRLFLVRFEARLLLGILASFLPATPHDSALRLEVLIAARSRVLRNDPDRVLVSLGMRVRGLECNPSRPSWLLVLGMFQLPSYSSFDSGYGYEDR
ncbi:hypothetical protein FB45DRAFT_873775 [Roridomyces roridus]|uniref:Uncharacterized protein n=1 Tax=Roridomyces roridus TaxID=1738132 RepID=A0AAD7FF41_9AGAR|nr:hypothetical protein FB45DRAFT_873775 [Roridomyces roridus]